MPIGISGISNGLNLSMRIRSSQCPRILLRWQSNSGMGGLIPPEWEFQSEVWEYVRKRVQEDVYDHESEVGILR